MPITVKKENSTVALVTMDLGENRFNPDFVSSFISVLDSIEADESYKSVVLCSGDDKFWSLGIDIEWVGKTVKEGKLQDLRDFLYKTNSLMKKMLTFPMPIVAAIGGHAFGDGAILALCCDFRFMKTDRGFFCFPEVDINVAFLPSNLEIVRKILPAWFMEDLVLSGRKVGAAELAEHHLVKKACDNEESMIKEAVAFAAAFSKPRGIFAEHKRRINKSVFELMESTDPKYIEPLNLNA